MTTYNFFWHKAMNCLFYLACTQNEISKMKTWDQTLTTTNFGGYWSLTHCYYSYVVHPFPILTLTLVFSKIHNDTHKCAYFTYNSISIILNLLLKLLMLKLQTFKIYIHIIIPNTQLLYPINVQLIYIWLIYILII
jgi:hypothetical protein